MAEEKEPCGCRRIVPETLSLRIPTLPLNLSAVKEMGWQCHCGATFLPLASLPDAEKAE